MSVKFDSTLFDIQLAHSRIVWLNRSSNATQEEFALKLMNEEPQGEAFDATSIETNLFSKLSTLWTLLLLLVCVR
jgi:hypothetical protein